MKVQIIIEYETGKEAFTHDVACLTRGDLLPETLGITLSEGKDLLAKMQKEMVYHQVAEYIQQHRYCSNCSSKHSLKDSKYISFRTPFGKLKLDSPRFYTCNCQPRLKKIFSPLAVALPEKISPEFLYLESKWPSLMSFGLTADIINEILPIDIRKSTLHYNSMKVAERLEDELGEEQWTFIEGCEGIGKNCPSLIFPSQSVLMVVLFMPEKEITAKQAGLR